MSAPLSLRRRLAQILLGRARWLLPASRLDWASAMQAEADYLGSDHDALRWAIGCFVAAMRERTSCMFANLRVSRWILVPEMLLCFLPLTLLWVDAITVSSGIVRLHGGHLHESFLRGPGASFAFLTMLSGTIVGALGPLSLAAAFRLVVLGRPPGGRWFRGALVAGPALYGVLSLTARVAMAGAGALGFDAVDSFDFWSGMLLLSALPSLGALHLLHQHQITPRRI